MNFKEGLIKVAVLAFSLATVPTAGAQQAPGNPFQQCAAESGLTPGQRPNEAQRQAMLSCVKAARKTAHDQCAAAAGFTPGQGEKPTAEQQQNLHECMKAEGFSRPMHHHHRHQQPEAQAASKGS